MRLSPGASIPVEACQPNCDKMHPTRFASCKSLLGGLTIERPGYFPKRSHMHMHRIRCTVNRATSTRHSLARRRCASCPPHLESCHGFHEAEFREHTILHLQMRIFTT